MLSLLKHTHTHTYTHTPCQGSLPVRKICSFKYSVRASSQRKHLELRIKRYSPCPLGSFWAEWGSQMKYEAMLWWMLWTEVLKFSKIAEQAPCVCLCSPVRAMWLLSHFSRFQLLATLQTIAYQAPYPWDSPGKNTRVGCHALLQGIFLTQGSNPSLLCLLLSWADSLPLDHLGSQKRHLNKDLTISMNALSF